MKNLSGISAAAILLVVLLCSAGFAWGQLPALNDPVHNLARSRALAPTASHASAILAVLVTDLEPEALIKQDRIAIRASHWTGPFRAHETRNLQVLTVLDRRITGSEAFDLVVTFKLADGSIFQKRVIPVDPASDAGQKVFRPALAPQPIRIAQTPELGVLSRVIPSEAMQAIDPNVAIYTPVSLPVSGTWITQHNLYGLWTVEVSLKRNRRILSTGGTTFVLMR